MTILFLFGEIHVFPLPGNNTGNQPPHLRWEPLLSRPVGNGVDKDEAQPVTDSHSEHNYSENWIKGKEGATVSSTEISS